MQITMIGLDLAKNVFQVHGVDGAGVVGIRRRLKRGNVEKFFAALAPCRVGIEACGGAHHWARRLTALGHEVRILPPQYVRPYVKTNKNDAADAGAICEAMQRPEMRFVAMKSIEQQALLTMHRVRELLIAERVSAINAIRAHAAEFGLVIAQGPRHVPTLLALIEAADAAAVPAVVKRMLGTLAAHLEELETRIAAIDGEIHAAHRSSEASQRLATIPGVGVITASALVASIGDASQFKSARHLAAWLGLVPRQNSTGGKTRLGPISKRGDPYLRKLLIHGARSVVRWRRAGVNATAGWLAELIKSKPPNVAATALANKNARIVWALLTRKQTYKAPNAAAPAAAA